MSRKSRPMGLKQRVIALTILMSVFGFFHYILAISFSNEVSASIKLLLWLFMFVGYLLLPLGFISNVISKQFLPRVLKKISFIWMGHLWIWLSVYLFFSILSLLAELIFNFNYPIGIASLVVSLCLSLMSLWGGHKKPRLTKTKISIPHWPNSFSGLKIIQLSDLHLGLLHLDEEFLRAIVFRINQENVDLVMITGDLVEGPPSRVAEMLGPLKDVQARLGRFYVTGNHEYYHGGSVWEDIVTEHGWTVLSNSHHIVNHQDQPLAIVGVTDHMAGSIDINSRSNPDLAFRNLDPSFPNIFLAHEPRSFAHANKYKIDLQLSGHTHGGQIFPLNFLVYLQQPMNRGLKKINESWIYTHMGTGFWGPPMRLGTHSEIALIVIE